MPFRKLILGCPRCSYLQTAVRTVLHLLWLACLHACICEASAAAAAAAAAVLEDGAYVSNMA